MTTRRRRTRSGENTEQGIIWEKENLDISVDTMSSCRDRTAEFVSAVRSLQSRQVGSPTYFEALRAFFHKLLVFYVCLV